MTERPVPLELLERWQQELEQVAARSEQVSWLKLVWDVHVGRWFIYQVFPQYVTPALYLADDQEYVYRDQRLQPDPTKPLRLERRHVSAEQWELYQETGCYCQPFWCIQGEHGGHKLVFTSIEKKILAAEGLPNTPPEPGTLSYAPFDRRVIEKLVPLDKLKKYHRMLDFCLRNPEQMDAEDAESERYMRERVWKWLETQVAQSIHDSGVKWGSVRADAPEGDRRLDEKLERAKDAFLNQRL